MSAPSPDNSGRRPALAPQSQLAEERAFGCASSSGFASDSTSRRPMSGSSSDMARATAFTPYRQLGGPFAGRLARSLRISPPSSAHLKRSARPAADTTGCTSLASLPGRPTCLPNACQPPNLDNLRLTNPLGLVAPPTQKEATDPLWPRMWRWIWAGIRRGPALTHPPEAHDRRYTDTGALGSVGRDTDTVTVNDGVASELNRELTGLLLEAGRRLGFIVQTEYPVRGGRLDVVWSLSLATPVPGLDGPVPVFGFEVESSWRTRKHVKGDYLNLADAGVALGVIVLAGADLRDESLRRFAETLVDRPGPRVLVWTADDVRALAEGGGLPGAAVTSEPITDLRSASQPSGTVEPTSQVTSHSGKYAPLWRWLKQQDRAAIPATFAEIEVILGFPLPDSCRNHAPHWHSYEGSAVARAIIDAGWRASRVHLGGETVTLVRAENGT